MLFSDGIDHGCHVLQSTVIVGLFGICSEESGGQCGAVDIVGAYYGNGDHVRLGFNAVVDQDGQECKEQKTKESFHEIIMMGWSLVMSLKDYILVNRKECNLIDGWIGDLM